jgi:hypothetical protein
MKYDIGESGIFNKQGYTPYEAVLREPLHNVFNYANVRAIQLDDKNREIKRKNRKKK